MQVCSLPYGVMSKIIFAMINLTNLTKIVLCSVFCILLAGSSTSLSTETPLLRLIPLIDIREQKAHEVIEQILSEFKQLYPADVIYDSFLISSDYAAEKRITLHLKNVPLEVALNAVADSLALRIFYKDRKLILLDEARIAETYFAAPLTAEVVSGLKLSKPISAQQLAATLKELRIDLPDNPEITFDEQQTFVRIRVRRDEAKLLDALFQLFNRGVKVSH